VLEQKLLIFVNIFFLSQNISMLMIFLTRNP